MESKVSVQHHDAMYVVNKYTTKQLTPPTTTLTSAPDVIKYCTTEQ